MLKSLPVFFSAICSVIYLAGNPAAAQSIFDPTFTPTVLKLAQQSGAYAVRTMLQQPDGKVLTGGSYHFIDNQRASRMRRLNADGTPDVAFAAQTGTGTESGTVVALALQSTGKILVGCAFTRTYNGIVTGNLVRLNATGSVDASFNVGGEGLTYNRLLNSSNPNFGSNIRTLTVQTDDKIIIGGNLERYNGQATANLLRLNPDGTPDTSFNVGSLGLTDSTTPTIPNSGYPEALLVQPDGKIVVGGLFARVNGVPASNLVRLNTDGTIDNTFLSTGTNGVVRTLARQPDGKLLVGGLFTLVNGQNVGSLVRLNTDGTRDASFVSAVLSPVAIPTGIFKVRVNTDGSIMACGTFTAYNGIARGGIAKVSATGILDTSFGPAMPTTAPNQNQLNIIYDVLALTNGQMLAGGTFTTLAGAARTGLARLNSSATQVDATYNPVIEFGGSLSEAIPLNNGDIILNNVYATSINGTTLTRGNQVQRLSNSGSYLGPVVLNLSGYVFDTFVPIVQPDGRIYVVTMNFSVSSNADYKILRLLANGNPDTSFSPVTLTYPPFINSSYLAEIHPLPNGDVLLLGDFTAVNGQSRLGFARVSSMGVLDQAFTLPGVPWQMTGGLRNHYLVGIQPNGQPLVQWYNNMGSHLVRLSATTGAIDNSFSIGTGASSNASYFVTMQPNGQAIVNGNFTSFNGYPTPNGMVRLLSNGQPDPTFTAAASLYIIAIQPDGRILGAPQLSATAYFSAPILRLSRLNTDGSLDNTLPTIELPQSVYAGSTLHVVLQPQDGKILLYGELTSLNGQFCASLVRISNTLLATRPAFAGAPALDVFPNPAHQQVTLRIPAAAVSNTIQPVTLLDMQGRAIRRYTLPARQSEAALSLSDVAPGIYLLQTSTSQGVARQRVVVTN